MDLIIFTIMFSCFLFPTQAFLDWNNGYDGLIGTRPFASATKNPPLGKWKSVFSYGHVRHTKRPMFFEIPAADSDRGLESFLEKNHDVGQRSPAMSLASASGTSPLSLDVHEWSTIGKRNFIRKR